ncbi:hypothetical protein B0T18DRAFT_410576 [Schizothecium vesticola]|uniref:Uncharacterized protein n=1 Tax=Schizothecium vesticola TaxID=314040 RepID=A0AA40K4V0_9PEZI|nr:hypothetical protein B0T18DRAFT_410576 [Schizothecium vesticola]
MMMVGVMSRGVGMVVPLTGPILNWLAGAGNGLLAHWPLSPSVEEADVRTLEKHLGSSWTKDGCSNCQCMEYPS